MDVIDLKRRWEAVRKTCETDLKSAPLHMRRRWEAARDAAGAVADALEDILQLEKAAVDAWQEARHIESKRPKAHLRLVR